MTECPCCFKDTVEDGRCTRCGVVLPTARPMLETILRSNPRRRADQDFTGGLTDYARTKEDKA